MRTIQDCFYSGAMFYLKSEMTNKSFESIRQNVDLVTLDDKLIYLVGTAHISQSSADLAEEVIREHKPDAVAVELCQSRFSALTNPERWKETNILQVIRQGRVYVLMAQLLISAFQKKLGKELHIQPGAEMMRAVKIAQETGAQTVLADRDIKTTLKRTWGSLGFWSSAKLIVSMLAHVFGNEKIEAAEVERLKTVDALEELTREFSEKLPGVRTALIDERDQYLAAKIQDAPGRKVAAIVGAGHIPGIKKWLGERVDIEELETIPASRSIGAYISWVIIALLAGFVAYGFRDAGFSALLQMARAWIIVTGAFAAFGAALAFAHPLTVLASFCAAPLTTIHPVLASGWVAGIVEAWIRKPRVSDFETISDDIITLRGVLRNRISRILLVVISTNVFGSIGTVIGVGYLASLLN